MVAIRFLFSILLIVALCDFAFATLFIPIPIEKQLEESNGVIRGSYLGKNYKKLSTGEVVTEATFKVDYSSGLKRSDLLNPNNFKVLVPGGVWEGIVYQVYGSPTFSLGEESVLLLTKNAEGFSVTNMSLGKYKIYKEDGELYLSSEVFPEHPVLGSVRFTKFQEALWSAYGEGLHQNFEDKAVIAIGSSDSKNNSTGRAPSSISSISKNTNEQTVARDPASVKSSAEQITSSSRINVWWFVMIMAILGSFITYASRKGKR